jgi:hypothetical protein
MLSCGNVCRVGSGGSVAVAHKGGTAFTVSNRLRLQKEPKCSSERNAPGASSVSGKGAHSDTAPLSSISRHEFHITIINSANLGRA